MTLDGLPQEGTKEVNMDSGGVVSEGTVESTRRIGRLTTGSRTTRRPAHRSYEIVARAGRLW